MPLASNYNADYLGKLKVQIGNQSMREKFEVSRPKDLLARSNDGYLDADTDRDWVIWQLAWNTALSRESLRTGEGSPFSTLTAEEVEFVKLLYHDSQK